MSELDQPVLRPIVVIAAPRSGSSLLAALLSAHPDLWTLNCEDRKILEGPFHPKRREWSSNALDAEDLSEESAARLRQKYLRASSNFEALPLGDRIPIRGRGRWTPRTTINALSAPFKRPPIRLLDKDTRAALRIPFLRRLFPDAQFLHLTRGPRGNVASLMRCWLDPRRYNDYRVPGGVVLSDFRARYWSFVLPAGWQEMMGSRLAEVCAYQWASAHEAVIRELAGLREGMVNRVWYESLIDNPGRELSRIAEWAGLDPAPFARFGARLPHVQRRRPPRAAAARPIEEEVRSVLPQLAEVARRLGYAADGAPAHHLARQPAIEA